MIICCDIDGVVNNLQYELIKRYNQKFGTSLDIEDFTMYAFENTLPSDGVEYMYELLRSRSLWESLLPLPDAVWGIETIIKSEHELIFATATDAINLPWKIEWFKKYLPFVNTNSIMRVMNKKYVKCDVMIDDDLEQLKSNLCERICLSYPWNKDHKADYVYGIYRCNSWKDIINAIKKIERKDVEWAN